MTVPFIGPSYTLALRKAAIDRTSGMYLVPMESAGKSQFVLQSQPGYVEFADLGSPIRGMLTTNDRTFVVAGGSLYELNAYGAKTFLGALNSATGPVGMAYGVSQLVIVDGDSGYVLVLASNTFTEITAPGFLGSSFVEFLDNYFLFVRPATGQFYISAINDATTLDALDFATAESQPDNLVSLIPVQRRLILLGQTSTEVWFNSGNADFPFEREGTTIEIGCAAAHSVQEIDNSVFWIGRDRNGGGIVYRLNGYTALRISVQGVEEALQSSTDLAQAVSYCYQEHGSTFYAINAPGLTSTWVYEVRAGAWHERNDLDSSGQPSADRGVHHSYAFGKHLLGASDGKVYELDRTVHAKAGSPLVRERISPHNAVPGLTYQYFDAFHLDCTTGDTGQGEAPQVELFWSDDSGASWGNALAEPIGPVGNRIQRVTFRRLGRSRDRVWKLRFTGNARWDVVGVQVEMKPGNT